MKILKSKLLVALMVGGLMSGMLTFSTVSIVGQDTSSMTADIQSAPPSAGLWNLFVTGVTGFIGNYKTVFSTYSNGDNNNRANEYPTDALD